MSNKAQYNQSMKLIQQQFRLADNCLGLRFDQAMHQELPQFSRSRIQEWIQQGFIRLNGASCKPRQKVMPGDLVDVDVPEDSGIDDLPQAVEFEIVHEDDDVIVINKPAGLVVHPAAGHADGTLVNGLLQHDSNLSQLSRAGIVHRLDKDTTGLMVVARNLSSHNWLVDQLQQRLVKRQYLAVANGQITAGRTIDEPMGRHPVSRKKMAIRADGKPAITHFQVKQRFRHHTLISVQLETGRTHQIRVHLAHIRHPLLGDPVYAGRFQLPAGASDQLEQTLRQFKRQALHAQHLGFTHPASQQWVEYEAPVPSDLQQLLDVLEADSESATD